MADSVSCRNCGFLRIPDDIRAPGACPSCRSPKYRRERCSECELEKLHDAMASTHAGQLLARVLVYDHALAMRMHVSLDDVTPEEFNALCLLHSERNKKQHEDMERAQREPRQPMTHTGRSR